MDGTNYIPGTPPIPTDIGDFSIGVSPIEGPFRRGSYSSAIGFFMIGHSPIGLAYMPVPDRRRVIFLLPEYPDEMVLPELEDAFMLPAPEGWAY